MSVKNLLEFYQPGISFFKFKCKLVKRRFFCIKILFKLTEKVLFSLQVFLGGLKLCKKLLCLLNIAADQIFLCILKLIILSRYLVILLNSLIAFALSFCNIFFPLFLLAVSI